MIFWEIADTIGPMALTKFRINVYFLKYDNLYKILTNLVKLIDIYIFGPENILPITPICNFLAKMYSKSHHDNLIFHGKAKMAIKRIPNKFSNSSKIELTPQTRGLLILYQANKILMIAGKDSPETNWWL